MQRNDTEDSSEDEGLFDYIKQKTNASEGDDNDLKRLEGQTVVIAHRAESSCRGIMKVCQPNGEKKSKLPMVLKNCMNHFRTIIGSKDPETEDKELYMVKSSIIL